MKAPRFVAIVLSFALVAAPQMAQAGWWETAKEKATAASDSVAETARAGWDKTKSAANTAIIATSNAWQRTNAGVTEACDSTATWCSKHKEEIAATAIGVATIAAAAYFQQPATSDGPSGYSNLQDGTSVGPGRSFTPWQKNAILGENMARNGGVLRSDLSGEPLVAPRQYYPGYIPPANEAQVDHIYPRSAGGTNGFGNAQVLSREQNLLKGSTVPSEK